MDDIEAIMQIQMKIRHVSEALDVVLNLALVYTAVVNLRCVEMFRFKEAPFLWKDLTPGS